MSRILLILVVLVAVLVLLGSVLGKSSAEAKLENARELAAATERHLNATLGYRSIRCYVLSGDDIECRGEAKMLDASGRMRWMKYVTRS